MGQKFSCNKEVVALINFTVIDGNARLPHISGALTPVAVTMTWLNWWTIANNNGTPQFPGVHISRVILNLDSSLQ